MNEWFLLLAGVASLILVFLTRDPHFGQLGVLFIVMGMAASLHNQRKRKH